MQTSSSLIPQSLRLRQHLLVPGATCIRLSPIQTMPAPKKKKVDYEALNSRLMQIPKFDIASARDLLDIEITDIFQLEGRSPESLFEKMKQTKPEVDPKRLSYLRMAVYYAENRDNIEGHKLNPWFWQE